MNNIRNNGKPYEKILRFAGIIGRGEKLLQRMAKMPVVFPEGKEVLRLGAGRRQPRRKHGNSEVHLLIINKNQGGKS
ncbi:MAG: hypothetical protein H0Z38_07380 [Firmicutes bacterium]|nr:hypothetical protein [Bacillota bacterium]